MSCSGEAPAGQPAERARGADARGIRRLPIAVLISGRGTNLAAIAAAARAWLPVEIRIVLSDRADAAGLERAREFGLHAEVVAPAAHADRAAHDAALAARIDAHGAGLVVLAGYMRVLSPAFVARFAGRLLNVHPSLLPAYPGLHTHRRALAAGDAEHGATVHFVTEQLDGGPPVARVRVPVLPDDDEARLSARVQAREHTLYPAVIDWYATGRLVYTDGHAWLDGRPLAGPVELEESDDRNNGAA